MKTGQFLNNVGPRLGWKHCPHCDALDAPARCQRCTRDMCQTCISYRADIGQVCGLCLDELKRKS